MIWSVCRNDTPKPALSREPYEMCLEKFGGWTGEDTSKEHLVRSTAWVWKRHLQGEKGHVYVHFVI